MKCYGFFINKLFLTGRFTTNVSTTGNLKFIYGRDSAPDPAGGAHDAPSDNIVGWGGDYQIKQII